MCIEVATVRSGGSMSYCNGKCEHLNEKKHKCELTGERLTVMKCGGIAYTVHEHRGFCEKDLEVGE